MPTRKETREFIENLSIVDKQGNLHPFTLTPDQAPIFNAIMKDRAARTPIRFEIYQPRQKGVTTLMCAIVYEWAVRNPDRDALVVANSLDAKECLHDRIIGRFESDTGVRALNIFSTSAGSSSSFFGRRFDYVYGAHADHWRREREIRRLIEQSVPSDPDTMIVYDLGENLSFKHLYV